MHLFPSIVIKDFTDCYHGEFVSGIFRTRSPSDNGPQIHSGICIIDENDNRKFLVLKSGSQLGPYHLITVPKDTEVESFGGDWRLTLGDKSANTMSVANHFGAVLILPASVFMVAKDEGTGGEVYCDLNISEVKQLVEKPQRGYAYESWSIDFIDAKLNALLKLASRI